MGLELGTGRWSRAMPPPPPRFVSDFSQASLASGGSRSLRRRRRLLERRCRLRQTQIAYLGCGDRDRRRGVGSPSLSPPSASTAAAALSVHQWVDIIAFECLNKTC